MASPAGARAERSLSERHRRDWPRTLYAYDLDEARRVTGDKILLETPAGRLAVAAEYKSVDEGPLDLNDLQYQVVADSVDGTMPAFVVQFTHPLLDPPQPWAFRLWPVNDGGRQFGPVELTERGYVQFLYVLSRGAAGAGGEAGSEGAWITPWSEFAHLDDAWPDAAVWPRIVPARARAFSRRPEPTYLLTAQRFVRENGRLLGDGELAEVERLIRDRPALGAIRRGAKANLPPSNAPATVELQPTREIRDRFDRLCTQLNFKYQKLWEAEGPSDDSRDAYTDPGGWRGGAPLWWRNGA